MATTTLTPARNARSCGPWLTPPNTAAEVTRPWRPRVTRCSCTWAASSRVGVRTRARVPGFDAAVQALQDGEDEGGGLAAAGLGSGKHVAPGEGLGQRRPLDRGRIGKTEVGDPLQQRGVESEVRKTHLRTASFCGRARARRGAHRRVRFRLIGERETCRRGCRPGRGRPCIVSWPPRPMDGVRRRSGRSRLYIISRIRGIGKPPGAGGPWVFIVRTAAGRWAAPARRGAGGVAGEIVRRHGAAGAPEPAPRRRSAAVWVPDQARRARGSEL